MTTLTDLIKNTIPIHPCEIKIEGEKYKITLTSEQSNPSSYPQITIEKGNKNGRIDYFTLQADQESSTLTMLTFRLNQEITLICYPATKLYSLPPDQAYHIHEQSRRPWW